MRKRGEEGESRGGRRGREESRRKTGRRRRKEIVMCRDMHSTDREQGHEAKGSI